MNKLATLASIGTHDDERSSDFRDHARATDRSGNAGTDCYLHVTMPVIYHIRYGDMESCVV